MNGHLGPTWEIALGVILGAWCLQALCRADTDFLTTTAVVVLTTAAVAIYQVRKRRRQKKESRYVSRRDPEMVETGHGREREPHSPRSHKHRSFSAKSNYHSTRGSPNSSTSHIAAGVTKVYSNALSSHVPVPNQALFITSLPALLDLHSVMIPDSNPTG